jgi:hypothetical protein
MLHHFLLHVITAKYDSGVVSLQGGDVLISLFYTDFEV